MSRTTFSAVLLAALFAVSASAACQKDPPVMTPKEGELPPLPPASGTAIGYLVDNASQLELRDDQLEKLKQIDVSLAARNDSLDTQLRTMERPDEQQVEKGKPPARFNNAPGAQITTTPDAAKLHKMKAENDKDSLSKAFALLDPDQKTMAKRLLDERGISAPGGGDQPPAPRPETDGVPLEP